MNFYCRPVPYKGGLNITAQKIGMADYITTEKGNYSPFMSLLGKGLTVAVLSLRNVFVHYIAIWRILAILCALMIL